MPVSLDLTSERIAAVISLFFGMLISVLQIVDGKYDMIMVVIAFNLVSTIPLFLLMWEYRSVARSVMNPLRPVFVHQFRIGPACSVESAILDGKLGPNFWIDTQSYRTFAVSYISRTTGMDVSNSDTGRTVKKLLTISKSEQAVVRVTNPGARTITVDLKVYGNAPPREDSTNRG